MNANILIGSQILLWFMVILLSVVVFALARQLGILYQRIDPVGALAMNQKFAGGDKAPSMVLTTLDGREVAIAPRGSGDVGKARSQLLFFLSPTCPICKTLLPSIQSLRRREAAWLDIVLASDGGTENSHRAFVTERKLEDFPYILSEALGRAYAVAQLPYGVLIGEDGDITALGLVNSREHLDSLLEARRLGKPTIQDFLSDSEGMQVPVRNAHSADTRRVEPSISQRN